jgi:tetratricopeptide (TPR) repeat protein
MNCLLYGYRMVRVRLLAVSFRVANVGFAAFFACISVAAGGQTSGDVTNKSVLQQHYDDAQRSQSSGNLQQAAHQYRIFIADALGQLAISRARIEDYEKAAPLFDEALKLAPNSPVLQIDYAHAAFVHGDLSRSKSLAEEVIRSYPTNTKASAKAHLILGRVLMKMNKDEEARQQLEAAVALEPTFENGYALAVACLDMEDGKCAAKVFGEMLAAYGDTAVIHREFGRAYGGSDFQQEAIGEFEKAIAKDDRLPGVHYSLAAAYLASSEGAKTKEAEAELRKELEVSPNDALTYAALGHIEQGQRRYAEADHDLTRSIALDATNPDAYLYLGQLYLDTNRSTEAEAALRKSIALTKDVSHNRYQVQKAHYMLGRLLMQSGHADDARSEMQTSSALTKLSLTQDRNRLADYLQEQPAAGGMGGGDMIAPRPKAAAGADAETAKAAQQIDGFEKQIAPAIADSYNNLGAIAAGDKDFATALTYFHRAGEWNPSLEGLDYNWGRAAFSASQYPEAVVPLGRALRAHPEDASVRSMLGVSEYMTADYVGTLKTLQPMEAQVNAVPQLAFVYAASMVKAGNFEDGLGRLVALEKADPSIAEVHRELAAAYQKASRTEDATRETKQYESLKSGQASMQHQPKPE